MTKRLLLWLAASGKEWWDLYSPLGGWFGPRVPRESTAHGEQRPLAKLPLQHAAGAGEALGYFYRRISNSVKLANVVPIIAELVTATDRGQ